MSTAQQLGLIGNSIKVQSLPTASAETFGAGNRFYTLIGQQEGYITGHTYHTVVANDVYSWEDVAQAGPQGEDGLPALVCNDMWGFLKVGLSNARTETFNRTPIVGEKVVIFSTENQYALATIESVSETTVGVRFSGPIISTKGATGQQGPAGTTVYNNLSDIPVINQDLSASGFTPVANTYYRHTGATNDTFTQGVIYLYDTAYHKLGESGGGTTLNKYTLNVSYENRDRIRRVYQQAKGRVYIDDQLGENSTTPEWQIASIESAVLSIYATSFDNNSHTYYKIYIRAFTPDGKQHYKNFTIEKNVNPSISTGESTGQFNLIYYNDTEII